MRTNVSSIVGFNVMPICFKETRGTDLRPNKTPLPTPSGVLFALFRTAQGVTRGRPPVQFGLPLAGRRTPDGAVSGLPLARTGTRGRRGLRTAAMEAWHQAVSAA
jgi:hypothetical protein